MLKLSDLKGIPGLGPIIERAAAEQKAEADRAAQPGIKAAALKALREEHVEAGKRFLAREAALEAKRAPVVQAMEAIDAEKRTLYNDRLNEGFGFDVRQRMLIVELEDLAAPAVPAFVTELETMLADVRAYRSVSSDRRRVIGEPDDTGAYEVALQAIGSGPSCARRAQAILDALAEARTLHQLAPAEGERRIRELRAGIPPLVDDEVINETRQHVSFGNEPNWPGMELKLQPGVLVG